MNVENIVLNYIDDIICGICLSAVKDDIVGVTCCNSIYHGKCLETNRRFTSTCPRCEEIYKINQDNPLLTRLLGATTTHNDINNIYAAIYKKNPEHLKFIDDELQKRSKTNYHNKFCGYFPYNSFNTCFNQIKFNERWHDFSYGLLNGYDWKNTVAIGRAVWEISKHDKVPEDEHIYLVIYSCDYRKARTQLKAIISTIAGNTGLEIGYYIHHGLLVINIRGMVRKICIHIEYRNDPFWVIYVPIKYFDTYGAMYHPKKGVLMTVDAIISSTTDKQPRLSSLDCVMGYSESIQNFSNRIGCTVQSHKDIDYIYPDYHCRITERYGIDNIKKATINKIAKIMHDIIDIEYCIDPDATTDITIELVSENLSVPIPCNIITPNSIKKRIVKIICKQPMYEI